MKYYVTLSKRITSLENFNSSHFSLYKKLPSFFHFISRNLVLMIKYYTEALIRIYTPVYVILSIFIENAIQLHRLLLSNLFLFYQIF